MAVPEKNRGGTPTDYRATRRQQEKSLLYLVIFVLVVIGTGLIGLIWGPNAAVLGAVCLVSGAILIGGLWFLLSVLQRIVGD
jgi:hypothetical protein